jgi:hypothetical protein
MTQPSVDHSSAILPQKCARSFSRRLGLLQISRQRALFDRELTSKSAGSANKNGLINEGKGAPEPNEISTVVRM